MVAGLEALWSFQQTDLEVDRFEAQLKSSKRRQMLLKLRAFLKEQQDAMSKLEGELEQLEGRVEQLKAQNQLRNNELGEMLAKADALGDDAQAVRALLTDARHLAELFSRSEHDLERMKNQTQALDKQRRDIHSRFTKAKSEYDRVKAEYDEELAQSSGELETLRAARESKKADIPAALMDEYLSVKKRKIPPMALLANEQCMGCNMGLPVAMLETRRSDRILECENCGRILFIQK